MTAMRWVLLAALATGAAAAQESGGSLSFEQTPGKVFIRANGKPFATYVYEDARISRPYLCDVYAPNGVKVTRNNPPVEGQDPTDHDTFHPGIWLAFGDVNGADTWRNKAAVRHVQFVEDPHADDGTAAFTVQNEYLLDGKRLCLEETRLAIALRPAGTFLLWDTALWSPEGNLVLGDQEEMGLGLRMATPLTVKHGNGVLRNSDGAENEAGVWGKKAEWCDYSGSADGQYAGILLVPHPDSRDDAERLGEPWFHARDYGLLVANHFGRNAFTKGEKSRLVIPEGKALRLSYGLVVHGPELKSLEDLEAACGTYLALAQESVPEGAKTGTKGHLLYDKLHDERMPTPGNTEAVIPQETP